MKFRNYNKRNLGIILAVLVLLLVFSGPIYRKLIKPNRGWFPTPITRWIEARDSRKKPSPIVYKEEKTLKVLEGWTIEDIASHLETLGISEDEFIAATGEPKVDYREDADATFPPDYSLEYDFLGVKPEYYSLEGFLFPDTYRIYADSSAQDVVKIMLDNFSSKLSEGIEEKIIASGKDLYDVLIMASLIEKEAPIDYSDPENTDARIVSGIFWGRLEIGQALQSDATLSYWLNDNNPAHSAQELEEDTLYNSYMYRGLPPTPISNPGLRAIEAAIDPLDTEYNYFLTDLKGDNIYYAKTYQEHLNNKYKYLK